MSTMEPLVELPRAAQKGPAARLPASRVHLSQPVHLGSPTVEQKPKGYQSHRLPLWWACEAPGCYLDQGPWYQP